MAIDTAAKRWSMLAWGNGGGLPIPDGTIDAGDRATMLDEYSGITAALAPTTAELINQGLLAPRVTTLGRIGRRGGKPVTPSGA